MRHHSATRLGAQKIENNGLIIALNLMSPNTRFDLPVTNEKVSLVWASKGLLDRTTSESGDVQDSAMCSLRPSGSVRGNAAAVVSYHHRHHQAKYLEWPK